MTTWTGQRLRNARARKRHPDGRTWTRQDIVDATGASLRSVASWERGEATPQAHYAAMLDDLFADSDVPASHPTDDTARIRRRLTEILAEAMMLVTQLERPTAPRVRDQAPERIGWASEDAPSAKGEAAAQDSPPEGRALP